MASYDLDTLWSNTLSINNYSVTPTHPTDVFEFDFYGFHNITLYLHDISTGDNANLYLYRDSNGNQAFDNSDTLVSWSVQNGDVDDVIDYDVTDWGTYFAVVSRGSGSTGLVSYDLDLNANRDTGSLGVTPYTFLNSHLTDEYPAQIFEFDLSGSRAIHLTLRDINVGADGDLRLYQDNGNGIFDDGDTLLSSSTSTLNNDESIDYRAGAGTYFAEVTRNGVTSTNDTMFYDFRMSATFVTTHVSNLIVGEIVAGDITYNTPDRTGHISNTNTTDTYAFSLETYEGVNISLSGLTSDANLQLIQDKNNNGIIDSGEVVDGSYTFGAGDEQINNITLSGSYFLQVFQGLYGGPTSYTVEFDHFTTPHA